MINEEQKKKFDIVNGVIQLMSGMYGILDTDYGRGVMQGIFATLRALGMEGDFREYLDEIRKDEEQ